MSAFAFRPDSTRKYGFGIITFGFSDVPAQLILFMFQLDLFQQLESLVVIDAQHSLGALGVLVNIIKRIFHLSGL